MKVYVASSWRNPYQQDVVAQLRADGHDVYDFQHPPGGDHLGFSWSDVDPDWRRWGVKAYMLALTDPIAQAGFDSDFGAMQDADACVLVLPCGRSAHLEAGYFVGAGKPLYILLDENEFPPAILAPNPELMYKMATLVARYYGPIRDALRIEAMIRAEPDSDLHGAEIDRAPQGERFANGRAVVESWQAGYDAAITDTFGVEPDDSHDRVINHALARIGQDVSRTAQYLTLDESTQRVRAMTDDEIAEHAAKVLPQDERLPLDMDGDMPDNTRSESTIDSPQ